MTELVSGEAVVLDIPCAQYPSRIGALLIDMLVQLASLAVVLIIIFSVLRTSDQAVLAAVFTTSFVLAIVGYPVVFETLSRGRTLGKMALGLRVISDDGGPIRFRQALVRALTGAIEIWSLIGAPVGLFLSIVSVRGKRLGDMFAGTYVIQERMPPRPGLAPVFAAVPPPLAGWAQVAETAGLSDQTAEAASSYLRRYYQLTERPAPTSASSCPGHGSPGQPPAPARHPARRLPVRRAGRAPPPGRRPPGRPAALPAAGRARRRPLGHPRRPARPRPGRPRRVGHARHPDRARPAGRAAPPAVPASATALAPPTASAPPSGLLPPGVPAPPAPPGAWTASGEPEPARPAYGFTPPG